MKLTKKIPAFTLSELIIVLILTSIIVGLAFSVLGLVNKQLASVRKNYDKKVELDKLQTALFVDFNTFSNSNYTNNTLLFHNNLNRIQYRFFENYILRDKDTFYIPTKNKLFYFKGENTQDGKIDAIKIETTQASKSSVVFAYKQNDASIFMN